MKHMEPRAALCSRGDPTRRAGRQESLEEISWGLDAPPNPRFLKESQFLRVWKHSETYRNRCLLTFLSPRPGRLFRDFLASAPETAIEGHLGHEHLRCVAHTDWDFLMGLVQIGLEGICNYLFVAFFFYFLSFFDLRLLSSFSFALFLLARLACVKTFKLLRDVEYSL